MITPNAFHLLIKHLNAIDQKVSSKLFSKRPWNEISLTSLLCDLMDEDVQKEESIKYRISKLNKDLKKDNLLSNVEIKIETNQFSSDFERYVSQSDLGVIIKFNNLFNKTRWEKAYLLQAKRIIPHPKHNTYSEGSKFNSIDKEQETRIALLQKLLGNTVKYLFYCPRPERLDQDVRGVLADARLQILTKNIFDYIDGHELRRDLMKKQKTTGAGLFISQTTPPIKSLHKVHSNIFINTIPFSWFIANMLVTNSSINTQHQIYHITQEENTLAKSIITGNTDVIEKIKKHINPDKNDIPKNMTIYPKHTIAISYTLGSGLNPDRPI